MTDDPNETLTNIEAEVLCLRYGINNIDESNSIKKLREDQSKCVKSGKSYRKIAQKFELSVHL